MSGDKSFQHKAKAFSKLVWDPHIIVVQHGSDAVSTSTRQIYFNGLGSSFQWTDMQIINTLDSSLCAVGKLPSPSELYVSMSHVRTRVGSRERAEDNNGLL